MDSVVERKFKKKQELIEKNLAVVQAAWEYAIEHDWVQAKRTDTSPAMA